MSTNNKRYFAVGILLCLAGVYKIYTKGVYHENGDIHWFTILFPLGLGVAVVVFALSKILVERNKK